MPEYHHSHFDGVTITPQKELVLDYFDCDQGGTRLCFRYIFSLRCTPRLLMGYTHETKGSETRPEYGKIPPQVFADAQKWLSEQLIGGHSYNSDQLAGSFSKHLKFFDGLNHTVTSADIKT